MPRTPMFLVVISMLVAGSAATARAQDRLRAQGDVLLYGDNTEFRNPFREGETIFGTAARAAALFDLGDRVVLTGGVYGRLRFGDEDAFELVRPVIALSVRGGGSTFTIGTLPSAATRPAVGDAHTAHGLLPPLQRETLRFERGHESGLMWTHDGRRVGHAAWLNWQRLNTERHRERFDAGGILEWRVSDRFSIPLQAHVVHEGGQLFAAGAVSDSYAGAAGLAWLAGARGASIRTEAFVLGSRHVPDREDSARSRTGKAVLGRVTADRRGWRAHLLAWRGRHFVKEEGDANYLSLRRNGSYYGGTRDYAEAGVARAWRPAEGVHLEASARLHRVERHIEYSYRVLATTVLDWPRR